MTVRCAWCLRVMEEKDPLDDLTVSHTICPSCLYEQEKEIRKYWNGEQAAADSAAGYFKWPGA